MLVANGHGLTAVKIPKIKAVIAGIEPVSYTHLTLPTKA